MNYSEKYDIFLSYRRDGGETMAILLRDRLAAKGYKVFLDIESLNSGSFNKKLFSVIEECTDVVVVCSKNSLDRCKNEGDWVRMEIVHALKCGKNVVPVMLRGFEWPDVLPDEIEELRMQNGVNANSNEYFDAAIDRLASKFLQSAPKHSVTKKPKTPKQPKSKNILAIILSLVVVAGLVFGGIAIWGKKGGTDKADFTSINNETDTTNVTSNNDETVKTNITSNDDRTVKTNSTSINNITDKTNSVPNSNSNLNKPPNNSNAPLTDGEGVIINGVKWATRNVDKPGTFAAKPEDAGMFYQWNRKKAWLATGTVTDWDATFPVGDTWEKANDPSPAGWRVPTPKEVDELSNSWLVRSERTTVNGIWGMKFTDIATGNSIFLPAAGRRADDGTLNEVGSNGCYWISKSLDFRNARCIFFDNRDIGFGIWDNSAFGFCVRPVAE